MNIEYIQCSNSGVEYEKTEIDVTWMFNIDMCTYIESLINNDNKN